MYLWVFPIVTIFEPTLIGQDIRSCL